MLNKSLDKKFSEEQFLTLVFFHKNTNSERYWQKTVFWGVQIPIKKKAAGGLWNFQYVLSDTILHHFQQSDLCPHSLHFFLRNQSNLPRLNT